MIKDKSILNNLNEIGKRIVEQQDNSPYIVDGSDGSILTENQLRKKIEKELSKEKIKKIKKILKKPKVNNKPEFTIDISKPLTFIEPDNPNLIKKKEEFNRLIDEKEREKQKEYRSGLGAFFK
jgi:hypothetical protein